MLDVEPMPRARIIKMGFIILDRVKSLPVDQSIRIYYEEYAKWVMEQADEIEDIPLLEEKLGKIKL